MIEPLRPIMTAWKGANIVKVASKKRAWLTKFFNEVMIAADRWDAGHLRATSRKGKAVVIKRARRKRRNTANGGR